MSGRISYLDGLRGWASFVVVLYHFDDGLRPAFLHPPGSPGLGSEDFSMHALGAAVLRLAFDGKLAVAIFFILSGIVLSGAVSKAIESSEDVSGKQVPRPTLPGLILKRYVRLSLPMTASALLGFVALLWFSGVDFQRLGSLSNLSPESWTTRMAHCSACMSPTLAGALQEGLWATFQGYLPDYNHVLWTMPIEFIGSILVFLLAFAGRTPSLRIFAAAVAFLASRGSYFGDFLIGVLIYELAPVLHRKAEVRGWSRCALDLLGLGFVFLGFAGTALSLALPQTADAIHAQARQLGSAIGWEGSPALVRATLVTSGCALSPTLQRLLSGSASRFLGRISFSLYLIHTSVLMMVAFPVYIHFVGAGADASMTTLLLILLVTPLAIGLSVPYYEYVERPSIALAGTLGRAVDRGLARCWPRRRR